MAQGRRRSRRPPLLTCHRNKAETALVCLLWDGHIFMSKLDLLQGTLDLMVLQTLHGLGPLHGYGIARRIEQISGDEVLLNQGTIYASLVRLQHRGWITAAWGTSDNNRRAKYYALAPDGRAALARETAQWHRIAGVMGRVLATAEPAE
jgi:PadR family transcriptional regulator PadR